ncbi:hypothetical protein BASA81_018175 [Batrachochytrium salamandrivorans]|nr:hypothetical protein BASA81_018175 [Batrachochytrium salamandrivorans]
MLGTLLNGNALSWYNPVILKTPISSSPILSTLGGGPRFKEKFRATFGEINQEQVSESKLPCSKNKEQSALFDLCCRNLDKLTADIDWKRCCSSIAIYYGLSSEIKDRPGTLRQPLPLYQQLWIWRFGLIIAYLSVAKSNGLFHQGPSSSYLFSNSIISCFKNQQQQQQIFFKPRQPCQSNSIRLFYQLTFC